MLTFPTTLFTEGALALWSPLDDPSMVEFFDGRDESSIDEDDAANRVSKWTGVNGHELIQTTAANQPRTGVSTINGHNVVDADTAGMYLEQVANEVWMNASGDHAAYGYFGALTVSNENDAIWSFDNNNDYQLEAGNGSNFRMKLNVSGLGGDIINDSGNHNGPSVYGARFTWNATTGTKQSYVDGVGNDNGPNGYTGTKIDVNQELTMFINRGKAQAIQTACLGFAVTDDSSDATRFRYEGFFAHLAGTQAALGAGHLYFTNPPLQ